MKVFRELEFRGRQDAVASLLEEISADVGNGWSRNRRSEKGIGTLNPMYCFECSTSGERQAAALWIAAQPDESRAYVANIVPIEKGELSFDEYNKVLTDFYSRFIKPREDRVKDSVKITFTSDEKVLEDWVSAPTAKLLRSFSTLANKSTGSSHPRDRKRWFDFLISEHKDRMSSLSTYELKRWLVEAEGWPEDTASDLAIEFEFATGLLDEYDKQS